MCYLLYFNRFPARTLSIRQHPFVLLFSLKVFLPELMGFEWIDRMTERGPGFWTNIGKPIDSSRSYEKENKTAYVLLL